MPVRKKYNLSYTQISTLSFLGIILCGTLLLMLPISSREGEITPFINAFFTATSATCVTGLVVYDTYQYFSTFGQIVILLLIQIGGLGFMTIATLFSLMLRRKIGLKERGFLKESVSTIQLGGVVRLTKHILIGTLMIEGLGALLLTLRFIPEQGFGRGLYYGIFHAVSAFCNAGFDLMGCYEPYSSLTRYSSDFLVNGVIMSLIVIGGIGFLVWEDIYKHHFKISKYQLHTKIVLVTTGALIGGAAILFYIMERNNTLVGMSPLETILVTLFQVITPRTAGFNTIDTAAITESTSLLTIVLMMIGGSPGSTAGGIKSTTLVVLLLSFIASLRHSEDLNIFGRRLEHDIAQRAHGVITIYLMGAVMAAMTICFLQPLPLTDVFFEVFSAIGTVGMSKGITRDLTSLSRLIIILLMFCGRVGSLSFALAFVSKKTYVPVRQPVEKITIG
ncbi:Trk family potassium uptake protein [Sporanaerobium hydrogeniformans]|uniref:Trk family potassium uptake protein n=1 Tax=Sporanaerobium hydrogeniformans TaxID=3072179 RepID=A0AC61DD22_9FIRM|nr:TrkH family potassium uptake protein [Sporanaerobium hydrogeniformans]PHV70492.1 Trk family potassium uptake protein [Sporanaerobium hydrogeniformans]